MTELFTLVYAAIQIQIQFNGSQNRNEHGNTCIDYNFFIDANAFERDKR